MGGALAWEREQWAMKDNSLGIAAPYETKSFHEMRGFRVRSLRSTVWVPELRSEGQDFFDVCDVFFKECTIWGHTGRSLDMMEGGVDEMLDKGGVARGGGNAELADSWRGYPDRNFVFLWTVGEDDVGSLRGIIRERFLFLWANMNDSSIGGDALGGLSLVSASFRHSGMYVMSHTQGSSNLLNHKGVVRLGRRGWWLF